MNILLMNTLNKNTASKTHGSDPQEIEQTDG